MKNFLVQLIITAIFTTNIVNTAPSPLLPAGVPIHIGEAPQDSYPAVYHHQTPVSHPKADNNPSVNHPESKEDGEIEGKAKWDHSRWPSNKATEEKFEREQEKKKTNLPWWKAAAMGLGIF